MYICLTLHFIYINLEGAMKLEILQLIKSYTPFFSSFVIEQG